MRAVKVIWIIALGLGLITCLWVNHLLNDGRHNLTGIYNEQPRK